jgi:hypothetical protein
MCPGTRSRQPTMPRTAVRAKPGTRRDPRSQLPATRGTDWNATHSNIEYLSRPIRVILARLRHFVSDGSTAFGLSIASARVRRTTVASATVQYRHRYLYTSRKRIDRVHETQSQQVETLLQWGGQRGGSLVLRGFTPRTDHRRS